MTKAHYLKIILKVILENPEFLSAFKAFISDRMAGYINQCCSSDENDERNRGSIAAYRSILDLKTIVTTELGGMNIELEDVEDS